MPLHKAQSPNIYPSIFIPNPSRLVIRSNKKRKPKRDHPQSLILLTLHSQQVSRLPAPPSQGYSRKRRKRVKRPCAKINIHREYYASYPSPLLNGRGPASLTCSALAFMIVFVFTSPFFTLRASLSSIIRAR